jgi:hypothetical protein
MAFPRRSQVLVHEEVAKQVSLAEILGAIEYAQFEHSRDHAAVMRVQNPPARVHGCATCLALLRVVALARQATGALAHN